MKIIGDTHTHTMACGHAYSTLEENIAAAKALGHRFLAYTEHGRAMATMLPPWFFSAQRGAIPRVVNGVVILLGCEANILDEEGALDLSQREIERMDWVIAGLHDMFRPKAPRSKEILTRTWLAVAENPAVDCIGHLGNPAFEADYETVIKAFRAGDKVVEINSSSRRSRPGSEGNCLFIAKLCVRYGVPMVLSSDAHFSTQVGQVQWGLDLMKEVGAPEELVLNLDYERFRGELRRRKGIILPD